MCGTRSLFFIATGHAAPCRVAAGARIIVRRSSSPIFKVTRRRAEGKSVGEEGGKKKNAPGPKIMRLERGAGWSRRHLATPALINNASDSDSTTVRVTLMYL